MKRWNITRYLLEIKYALYAYMVPIVLHANGTKQTCKVVFWYELLRNQ